MTSPFNLEVLDTDTTLFSKTDIKEMSRDIVLNRFDLSYFRLILYTMDGSYIIPGASGLVESLGNMLFQFIATPLIDTSLVGVELIDSNYHTFGFRETKQLLTVVDPFSFYYALRLS